MISLFFDYLRDHQYQLGIGSMKMFILCVFREIYVLKLQE